MVILHGDDYVASRQELNQLIDGARQKNQSVSRLEAGSLEFTELTQLVESRSFFGEDNLIVIFGVLGQAKSSQKEKILDYLKENQQANIIIYEAKEIGATALKPFTQTKVIHHKPAPVIFNFLDSLKPGNAKSVVEYQKLLDQKTEPEFIFAMLVRQARLLIQATSPGNLKMPPWMKNKLVSQARAFSLDRLLSFHENLYQIDKNIKTGRNSLDLSTQIFSLLLNL